MLNRRTILVDIADTLAYLEVSVRNSTILRLYDINIVSEDFFCELLNKVYNYNLRNVNKEEKDKTAVDLMDTQNKVYFQVTSSANRSKITSTIKSFIEEELWNHFFRLCFVFIGTSPTISNKPFDTKGLFTFSPNDDIFDTKRIIRDINKIADIKHLRDIHQVLVTETRVLRNTRLEIYKSEQEKIAFLLRPLGRRVFHAKFDTEDPLEMYRALRAVRRFYLENGASLQSNQVAATGFENISYVLNEIEELIDEKYPILVLKANELDNKKQVHVERHSLELEMGSSEYYQSIREMMSIRTQVAENEQIIRAELQRLRRVINSYEGG